MVTPLRLTVWWGESDRYQGLNGEPCECYEHIGQFPSSKPCPGLKLESLGWFTAVSGYLGVQREEGTEEKSHHVAGLGFSSQGPAPVDTWDRRP